MGVLPADSNTVHGILRARIVHFDHNKDMLELALDIRNEGASTWFLKKQNFNYRKCHEPK